MEKKTLGEVAEAVCLSRDNTVFYNRDGYITMRSSVCGERFSGEPRRVLLHRLFPYEETDAYLSVQDTDQNELGMIRTLGDFDGESRAALESELRRKYFVQRIDRILEIKDRHGFTYWKVVSDGAQMLEFTVHDTYRSIFRVGDGRLVLTDVDGNRYGIDDVARLDAASYRRLELYL